MNTEDRELLEKAARAAGYEVAEFYPNQGGAWCNTLDRVWSPLDNDGDALRLAVKLQISVCQNIVRVEAGAISLTLAGVFIHEDAVYQDSAIATRRAIVRAAAAIGEQL